MACTDDGATGRPLSTIKKRIREVSKVFKYQTFIVMQYQLRSLALVLRSLPLNTRRDVHLLIKYSIGDKVLVLAWSMIASLIQIKAWCWPWLHILPRWGQTSLDFFPSPCRSYKIWPCMVASEYAETSHEKKGMLSGFHLSNSSLADLSLNCFRPQSPWIVLLQMAPLRDQRHQWFSSKAHFSQNRSLSRPSVSEKNWAQCSRTKPQAVEIPTKYSKNA